MRTKFRLMMCAFYELIPNDIISCARVYPICHPEFIPDR